MKYNSNVVTRQLKLIGKEQNARTKFYLRLPAQFIENASRIP